VPGVPLVDGVRTPANAPVGAEAIHACHTADLPGMPRCGAAHSL
jgi:hypothetical protein